MSIGDVAEIIVAISAVAALGVSIINYRHIQEVHISVNSRLTELLALTSSSERAAGRLEGRAEAADTQKRDSDGIR